MSRGNPLIPQDEFVKLFREHGPQHIATLTGLSVRGIYERRNKLEKREGITLVAPKAGNRATRFETNHPGRLEFSVPNGTILVGSDAHYWPGPPSACHRGFVKFCKELKPAVVVLNGDVIDAATISRHAPIGWETRPTVKQEIETAQERLGEIEKAAGKAHKVWTLGNHDARFETRLATVAPEFAKIHGVHLKDHFPLWEAAWSCWINDDVVIKHRFKGGIHAPHNNTMWAGKTMITGHLHSAKVIPLTDYNGTRYGVDTGCLADPNHKAFVDYTEDSPKNWRSAFGVLTFRNGQLMMPELAVMWDKDRIQFRSEIIRV